MHIPPIRGDFLVVLTELEKSHKESQNKEPFQLSGQSLLGQNAFDACVAMVTRAHLLDLLDKLHIYFRKTLHEPPNVQDYLKLAHTSRAIVMARERDGMGCSMVRSLAQ